jgi:hypothetical protein
MTTNEITQLYWDYLVDAKDMPYADLQSLCEELDAVSNSDAPAIVEQPVPMFRTLSPEETADFRQWARDNYTPGSPVNPVWHPVVQDECERMNREDTDA